MFFDTNKIHIQAFLLFINGKLIIFQSSSPQKHFKKYMFNIFFKQTEFSKNPKNNFKQKVGLSFKKSKIFETKTVCPRYHALLRVLFFVDFDYIFSKYVCGDED